jgi:hypothetical protein
MSLASVDRPFLTFLELTARWGGDLNLVRYALVNGELRPTFFVQGFGCIEGADGEPAALSGAYRLIRPRMSAMLDCAFPVASGLGECDRGAWVLVEPIPLSDVMALGFVEVDEVERYEKAHPRTIPLERVRRDLKTLERASLLKMVMGMAVVGYGYNPRDRRSKIVPEIAADVRRAGMSIDDDTVRNYLYEGQESHLPHNWSALVATQERA